MRVVVLTGGPGSGKTSLLCLIQADPDLGPQVVLLEAGGERG